MQIPYFQLTQCNRALPEKLTVVPLAICGIQSSITLHRISRWPSQHKVLTRTLYSAHPIWRQGLSSDFSWLTAFDRVRCHHLTFPMPAVCYVSLMLLAFVNQIILNWEFHILHADHYSSATSYSYKKSQRDALFLKYIVLKNSTVPSWPR